MAGRTRVSLKENLSGKPSKKVAAHRLKRYCGRGDGVGSPSPSDVSGVTRRDHFAARAASGRREINSSCPLGKWGQLNLVIYFAEMKPPVVE